MQYLLVGGGTASFAAMRAIRSARPDAQVLIVGEEPALPYMRPPLSKELWREPELARAADHFEALTFRQWNGKRRSVVYEPRAFYAPVERLAAGEGGACVARGWRVVRLDVAKHEAELRAADGEAATLRYDKCLVATGVRARRAEALRPARDSGRVLTLRSAADAARLASLLDRPETMHVAIVGGGFLASELSASLAERCEFASVRSLCPLCLSPSVVNRCRGMCCSARHGRARDAGVPRGGADGGRAARLPRRRGRAPPAARRRSPTGRKSVYDRFSVFIVFN